MGLLNILFNLKKITGLLQLIIDFIIPPLYIVLNPTNLKTTLLSDLN